MEVVVLLRDIWTKSNIGEKIIGIRSIDLMKNRRNIEYALHLKKYMYNKTDYAEEKKKKTESIAHSGGKPPLRHSLWNFESQIFVSILTLF